MEKRSIERLQFDRRLLGRRGWVTDQELQEKLDSLPDVSEKVAPFQEEEGEGTGSDGAG